MLIKSLLAGINSNNLMTDYTKRANFLALIQ